MKIKDRLKPKTPPVEPGMYMGVCIGVVDLGEQFSKEYGFSNRICFVWALPSETIEIDGKMEERQLSREFSFARKKTSKLRSLICSWNSKNYSDEEYEEFDPLDQIGKPCQLNVVLNDTGEYANVESVVPIPKGFPAPVSKTPFFTWDMDAWDDAAFEKLPTWVQEKIKKSTQYQKSHVPKDEIKVQGGGGEECPI